MCTEVPGIGVSSATRWPRAQKASLRILAVTPYSQFQGTQLIPRRHYFFTNLTSRWSLASFSFFCDLCPWAGLWVKWRQYSCSQVCLFRFSISCCYSYSLLDSLLNPFSILDLSFFLRVCAFWWSTNSLDPREPSWSTVDSNWFLSVT